MSITRMIHILHIFTSLPVGGAENLLLNTVKGLDPKRFKSSICCIKEKGEIGEEIESLGFSVFVLHHLQKGGRDPQITQAIVELIQQEAINIVHTHLYHANYYGRLAAKATNIPALASIHNTYSQRPKLHRRWINWQLAKHTYRIIAGSPDIKRDILRWDKVADNKVEVIPNTVDLKQSSSKLSQQQAREKLGLAPKALVLGTVGRLEEQKGHRILLEALPDLIKYYPHLRLLLIGDGRLRETLEQQSKALGLTKHVLFLGTRRDLGDLFRAMDIFTMPSLWEGLSLAMLSAMAAGLPTIATDVGGVGDVLLKPNIAREQRDQHYGYVIPSDNAKALRDAICNLIDDRELAAQLAQAGKAHVQQHYSHEAFIRRLMAIYEEMMEKRH